MSTQTLSDIYFALGFISGLAIPWLAGRQFGNNNKQPSRRPRIIVTLSQTAIRVEARKSFYADMMKDMDRDYVMVTALTDRPIDILEIR